MCELWRTQNTLTLLGRCGPHDGHTLLCYVGSHNWRHELCHGHLTLEMPSLWRPGYEPDLQKDVTLWSIGFFRLLVQELSVACVREGRFMVWNKFCFWLHTPFKVLEGLFTVRLLMVTMETLHSQTMQTHVTGQVISPDNTHKQETVGMGGKRCQSVGSSWNMFISLMLVTHISFLPTKIRTLSSGCMFRMKLNK